MPRVCHFSGASTSSGWVCKYRGKAKYLGGVGIKTTSRKRRTFKPNLQDVTIVEDGSPKRVKASTRAIRQGLVVKPIKRKYAYTRRIKNGEAVRSRCFARASELREQFGFVMAQLRRPNLRGQSVSAMFGNDPYARPTSTL